MKKHFSHQISLFTKVWISAVIFLSTVVVGGLAILAATNLNDLKAGANGYKLSSNSWDTLIDSVKAQNTALGVGLDQLETGLTQFNQTLINLFGSRDEKVRIGTVNESCSAGTAGSLRDNNWCLEYCNGSAWKSVSCTTSDEVPLRTIIATYGADQTTMNKDGWALCNGSSIASQVAWAAVAGNTPNLAGKMLVGAGTYSSATFTAGNDNYTYGWSTYNGEVRHTLTLNEMPSHGHTIKDSGHSHTAAYGRAAHGDKGDTYKTITWFWPGTVTKEGSDRKDASYNGGRTHTSTTNITITSTGGSQAHNNMPPFYVVQYYMKVKKVAN